jgi:hypothetical protein
LVWVDPGTAEAGLLQISDGMGQLIKTLVSTDSLIKIELTNLPVGCYTAKWISNTTGRVKTGKLMKI